MDKSNDNRALKTESASKHIRSKQKSLINAKDVLDQIKIHYCCKNKQDKPTKMKVLSGK